MLQMTKWTMSLMIGTVSRQHPLVDIDFHDDSMGSIVHLFTDERIQQAARLAGDRMFLTTGMECAARVMRTGGGSGIHVVALGYAITSHHVQANAEYVRQMHDAFDELDPQQPQSLSEE